ncbi:putative oxidoreductase [Cladorrhinum sp. PSN259]|nr:putative oxidoreductase [Cladorrhinum sp. PSN259]
MHVPYQRSLLAPDRPLILILGASRGIGMCMTQDLVKLGGHVMIVSRDFLAMQELREKYPNQVDFVFTDLALPAAPRLVIEATIQRWGKIDGLVINHSVLSPMTRVENGDIEDWMHVFNTNFFSAAMICKYAIPHLRKVKGRIIFVSSHATQDTYSAWGPYSASKAALEQLSKTIAAEEPRIKCVSISPGPVKTMMYDEIRSHQGDQMDPQARETLNEKLQTGQFLTPAQVGGVIMRLSIWATQEMSGQHFR